MKRFVCVKQQSPTDCGAACLATVARHHGLKLPLARIRQLTGTDQRGTSAYGIVTAAEKLGFRAKGVKAAKQHLTKDLALPCIAHVIKGQLQHYLVIHHISRGKLVIADPARGVVICSIEEFVKIWSGVLILLVPTGQFQKRDETKSLFSRLYPLLRPYRGILVQIFIASLLYSIFGILGAFYLKVLADHVLVEGMARTLHVLSIGFGLLAVLRVIIGALRNQLLLYACTKLEAKLVLQLYQHRWEMPVTYFDSYKVGEILARVSDTGKIRNAISHAVVSVMLDTVMVIVVGIVLLLQNRALFMVTLLLAPLLLLLFALFTGPYRAVQRRYMEQAAKLEAALVETLGGISLIKAHTAEQEVQRQTESKFNRVLAAALKDARLRNLQGSLHSGMTLIAQLLILWIGGMEILKGAISIGQLLTYNALLSYFLTPITNLAGLQPVLQEARVAAERLWETLELERESLFAVHKISLPHAFGGLRFENVSFRYGTRRLVLRDVNFTVAPGEKVAIVGPSGSGKTTIARLVLGFYQPEQGQILFGRFRLKTLACECAQELAMLPKTVSFQWDAVGQPRLGLREFEMEQIMALAEQLGIDAMINQLPERFLTMVGERGVNLSGGQKQQIALLRALIRRPEVLILDEATSHLDSIIEQEIQKAVYGIGSSMTIIVIAHRLSTITNCDKIVVLDGGQVTEIGTHSQLLDSYGTYYRLWQAQNGYREVCCVEH